MHLEVILWAVVIGQRSSCTLVTGQRSSGIVVIGQRSSCAVVIGQRSSWRGCPTPLLPMGKMCLFPFFPMGKNGKKSIWKERKVFGVENGVCR